MVRTLTLIVVLWVAVLSQARACDACGCAIGGSNIGLLAAYRYNFAGLSWQYAAFHGSPEHGEGSHDDFHTFEVAIRYYLSPRFKLLVNQPYRLNIRKLAGESARLNGIADTRMMGSYTLFSGDSIGRSFRLFLEIGAGAKLPVGAYDPALHDRDLPENFNIGNGSWAALLQPNLVLAHQNLGFMLNTTLQFNRHTPAGYRFGNQLTSQALLYGEIPLTSLLKTIPFGGINLEHIGEDTYANGKAVPGTGGKGLFLTAGFNFKTEAWMMGASYAQPLRQAYSAGAVDAVGRYSLQCSFLF